MSWAQGTQAYLTEIADWKTSRTEEIAGERGWAAVAGLFWLEPGESQAGTSDGMPVLLPDGPEVAGVFSRRAAVVTWTPSGGSPHVLKFDDEPWKLGRVWLQLIRRQDRIGLRMWDSENPRRKEFKGLVSFDLDPTYRVNGHITPHAKPTKLKIANVIGQTNEMESPGVVSFELKGQTYELTPVFETGEKKDLFYIFKDETAGKTTYSAGRFLHGDLPDKDGRLVLDFNKAYSPPCAFTDYATCPLPPPMNRLKVAIEAGEKDPHPHH